MSSGGDEFNFEALDDYSPWGSPVPPAAGVGLSLNTPSPQSSLATPPLSGTRLEVGTASVGTPRVNVTTGVVGSNGRTFSHSDRRHTFGTSY